MFKKARWCFCVPGPKTRILLKRSQSPFFHDFCCLCAKSVFSHGFYFAVLLMPKCIMPKCVRKLVCVSDAKDQMDLNCLLCALTGNTSCSKSILSSFVFLIGQNLMLKWLRCSFCVYLIPTKNVVRCWTQALCICTWFLFFFVFRVKKWVCLNGSLFVELLIPNNIIKTVWPMRVSDR